MLQPVQGRGILMESARHGATVRVLLVEDDDDDVLIMKDLLQEIEGTDFDIDCVTTYEDATLRLSEETYDIHFFDYHLGSNTGLDLIQFTQTLPTPAPSIILTGLDDRHVDLVAAQMGATDYVVKGELTPSNLERSIRYALERRRIEAEREALTQQLLETSRQLGKAEHAAHVLHNVGNVLNSITVSTSIILNILKEPFVEDIHRMATMMKEHQDGLAKFLTDDQAGSQIPHYLHQSSEHVTQQQAKALRELSNLTTNLEHVNHIIQAQHSIAKTTIHREPVHLPELLDRALTIVQGENNFTFEVQRNYTDIPSIMTDKHQLLQILVNLIRNAKQAMAQSSDPPNRLTLSIRKVMDPTETVFVSVQDSGMGMTTEHLKHIFSQRFTTKPEGQGLGLHSSALAAKLISGTLQAESPGPGQGATFTVTLPVWPLETHT